MPRRPLTVLPLALCACWSTSPSPSPDSTPSLTPTADGAAADRLGPPTFALVGYGARIVIAPPVRVGRIAPVDGAQAVIVDAGGYRWTLHPPSQLTPAVPGNERRATTTLVWLECQPATCDAIEPLNAVEPSPEEGPWQLQLGRIRLPWYEAGLATATGGEEPRVELATPDGTVFARYGAPVDASAVPDLTAVVGDAAELARGGAEPTQWADVEVGDGRERRFRVALPEDIVVVATYPGIGDDVLGQEVWGFTDDAAQIALTPPSAPPPPPPAPP